jgi:hypothetical protein
MGTTLETMRKTQQTYPGALTFLATTSVIKCYYLQKADFASNSNDCVYEPLRRKCDHLSWYNKIPKSTALRKPATSNGLYTLL